MVDSLHDQQSHLPLHHLSPLPNTGVGTTATGVAIINAAGTVTAIRYTNAGAGYTAGDLPISVTIADPSIYSGSGDFRL